MPKSTTLSLSQLGWQPFFQQQLSLQEWEEFLPARVVEQHRSCLTIMPGLKALSSQISPDAIEVDDVTVGDWLLVAADGKPVRRLDRSSLLSRKAAGSAVAEQLIAANIDTAFIMCAMDGDFNLARIERFLVLVCESGVEPVVVLSKADRCADPEHYVSQIHRMNPLLHVEAVNGLDIDSVAVLGTWLAKGRTGLLLGSSGVGKSTLINTLSRSVVQDTGGVRLDDSKGRHTTTGRSLHVLPSGGLLLDTPGMRELQLANASSGVDMAFQDVTALAANCKFSNCEHLNEPGCAVVAAIDAGHLEKRRLLSYRKLNREQAFNSATLSEKRVRDRNRGRKYENAQAASRGRKKGYSE